MTLPNVKKKIKSSTTANVLDTFVVEIKETIDFLPYTILAKNNGKILEEKVIDPSEGHPQKVRFYLSKESINSDTIELWIMGLDGYTSERRDAKANPIQLSGSEKNKNIAILLNLFWYGDGQKEFPIMINGLEKEELSGKTYWEGAPNVLEKIEEETGSSLSENDSLFLDGDKGGDDISSNLSAINRKEKGMQAAKKHALSLFARLKKNDQGEIIQKIQVYTHSRGSVYGDGFINQLKKEIKENEHLFESPNNVIDIVVHMDAHQSEFVLVKTGNHPTIAVSHKNSVLGDSKTKGDSYNITLDKNMNEIWEIGQSHRLSTFDSDLDRILDNHNKNIINYEEDKYNGYDNVFNDSEKIDAQKAKSLEIDSDKIEKYNSQKK